MKSSLGRFQVELALVRATAPHATEQAAELANYLKPGGAIVITSPDNAGYQAVLNSVRSRFPQFFALNFDDGRNGILLAAQLAG